MTINEIRIGQKLDDQHTIKDGKKYRKGHLLNDKKMVDDYYNAIN